MILFIFKCREREAHRTLYVVKIQLLDKIYEIQCGAIGNILGGACHGNLGNMR
jgi:hypothetical protein